MTWNLIKTATTALTTVSILFAAPAQAKWWETAIRDGAGAFFGAAEGSVFGPGGSVVGAILGGAAASLAIASPPGGGKVGVPTVWDPTGGGTCTEVNLPKPFTCGGGRPLQAIKFDAKTADAGYWHNRIVRAYVAEQRSYNREAFLKIAMREMGLSAQVESDPKLGAALQRMAQIGEENASPNFRCCLSGPRGTTMHYPIRQQVETALSNADTTPDLAQKLAAIERANSAPSRRDAEQARQVAAYLSVVRFSAAYWKTAEAIADGNCMIEPSRCGPIPAALRN